MRETKVLKVSSLVKLRKGPGVPDTVETKLATSAALVVRFSAVRKEGQHHPQPASQSRSSPIDAERHEDRDQDGELTHRRGSLLLPPIDDVARHRFASDEEESRAEPAVLPWLAGGRGWSRE